MNHYDKLWDNQQDLAEIGINYPLWIESMSPCDMIAIYEGGCASGSYMPAVTYHAANKTMSEYGDSVLEYIEDSYGNLPQPINGASWSGLAVYYLSMAVELWVSNNIDNVNGILDAAA